MRSFWNVVSMVRGTIINTVAEIGTHLTATFSGRTDEQIDDRQVFQNYGLQSRPRDNAEIIALRQGNAIVIIAGDDSRYRMALEKGDVVLYSDTNNYVKMKAGGGIEIYAGNDVIINSGGIKLGGSAGLKKLIHEEIFTAMNAHVHSGGTIPPNGLTGPPTYTPQLSTLLHATSVTEAL